MVLTEVRRNRINLLLDRQQPPAAPQAKASVFGRMAAGVQGKTGFLRELVAIRAIS